VPVSLLGGAALGASGGRGGRSGGRGDERHPPEHVLTGGLWLAVPLFVIVDRAAPSEISAPLLVAVASGERRLTLPSAPSQYKAGRRFSASFIRGRRRFGGRGTEADMDEDRFNMSVRKFLKQVGVTSQRVIEEAVRSGKVQGNVLKVKMTLTAENAPINHVIEEEIELR